MSEFLRGFAERFAALDKDSLDQLNELYSDDVRFQDPLHEVQGLGAVRLWEGCHSTLTLQEAMERVGWGAAAPPRARPSLVCFNLGYLPGGDRAVKTAPETTVPAVRGALDMLGRGGLLSVLVYVGHQGGPQEREAVEATLSGLSPRDWSCSEVRMVNRQGCPVLYLAERMSEPDPEPGLG